MSRSTIIFSSDETRRQQLGQRISALNIFERLYFCSTAEELITLVKSTATDLICCELEFSPQQLPPWADLVRGGLCRLLCFTDRKYEVCLRLPAGSCYLEHDTDASNLADVIESLLKTPLESPPPPASGVNKQVEAEQKIYSRFYFDSFLDKELSRSNLTGRPVSLLLIEPQLKHRHDMDDELLEPFLVRVSRAIKSQIRSSDLLCRYQRQRLAILLPETPSERAAELLDRIIASLRDTFPEQRIPWTSAVVAPVTNEPPNANSFMQLAVTRLERSEPRY